MMEFKCRQGLMVVQPFTITERLISKYVGLLYNTQ